MTSPADLDVAKKTLKLKSSTYCMNFVSTLWKGEVIMCCYNNITNEISNVFCSQLLEPDDLVLIEKLIKNDILLDNVI